MSANISRTAYWILSPIRPSQGHLIRRLSIRTFEPDTLQHIRQGVGLAGGFTYKHGHDLNDLLLNLVVKVGKVLRHEPGKNDRFLHTQHKYWSTAEVKALTQDIAMSDSSNEKTRNRPAKKFFLYAFFSLITIYHRFMIATGESSFT